MVVKCVTSELKLFKSWRASLIHSTLSISGSQTTARPQDLVQPQDGRRLRPRITLSRRATSLCVMWLRNKIPLCQIPKCIPAQIDIAVQSTLNIRRINIVAVPKHAITVNNPCRCKLLVNRLVTGFFNVGSLDPKGAHTQNKSGWEKKSHFYLH